MRLATVIVALLVALAQGFVAAGELTTDSVDARWAVLFAAAAVTGAGSVLAATGPLAPRGTVGLGAIGVGQLVASGLIVVALWHEWADAPAFGLDGLILAVLGTALLASACVATGGASALRPSPVRGLLLGLAGALLLLGAGAVAAGAATNVSRVGCGRFDFDRARWPSNEWRIAPALARCGTLEGRTRAQVRAMLGPMGPRAWGLEVAYADGRVREARFVGD